MRLRPAQIRLRRLATRFSRREDGAVLVEIAFSIPVMFFLLAGLVELGFFLLLTMKLQHTAVSVSDLTTRDEQITQATLDDIFTAAPQIMAPFPLGDRANVVISAISRNSTTPTRIFWQRSGGGTLNEPSRLGAEGETPTIDPALTLRDDETIVVTEVFYDYQSILFPILETGTVRRVAYFRPRLGALQTVN